MSGVGGKGAIRGTPLNPGQTRATPTTPAQTPIPLHTVGQKMCFWIPGMGVLEIDRAKKYCLGSGVAPQTPRPLHTMGQKRCFWIPGKGVLEMDNAKKNCLGSPVEYPYYPV